MENNIMEIEKRLEENESIDTRGVVSSFLMITQTKKK